MTIHRLFRACFAVLLIGTPAGTNLVSPTTTPTNPDSDYFLYIPSNAAARGPLQVLVTVHGMGGEGKSFCQNLISRAEQNGWIIVAPTFQYQDYHDPNLVLQDDTTMLPHLKQIIDDLPAKTGLRIKDKVLLYGFSRGAQIVHRFAEFYPDRTLAVALFSAGLYTLPTTTLESLRGRRHPERHGRAVQCERVPACSVLRGRRRRGQQPVRHATGLGSVPRHDAHRAGAVVR